MGFRSSPTFACIFVGMLEVMMLLSWEQAGGQMPYLWRGFIDDLFFLPSSSHPSRISANIPYSLAYRLKRIDGASLPGEDSI